MPLRLDPLNIASKIVHGDNPTPGFIIQWQALLNGVQAAYDAAAAALAAQADADALALRNINTSGGLQGGGNLTADRTLSLTDTAVTPGTYGDASNYPIFMVDQKGRLTAASTHAVPVAGTITAKDEGVNLTTNLASIDFVGGGVTATHVSDAVTVTIPGSTGGSGDVNPFSDGSISKPAATDFTIADDATVGHGTGSKVDLSSRGVEMIQTIGANSTTQSLFFKSAVSSTLDTMIAYIAPNFNDTNGSHGYFYGLAVRDNAGKIDSFGLSFNSSTGDTEWTRTKFTTISAISGAPAAITAGGHMAAGRPIWFKLQKVSTNFVFSVSFNGETYTTVLTQSATDFVGSTLNDVGIILYNGLLVGAKIVKLDVFSFTRT